MARQDRKQKSLTSHIFWGTISGVTGLWVANQYWKALPEAIKEGYRDGVSDSYSSANRDSSDYRIAAGFGAVYGITTFYVPSLRFVRKLIFGSAIWTFRGTKLLALLGGGDQIKKDSHPIMSMAKRVASRKGLEALVHRAER